VSFIDAADPVTYARFTKDVATPGGYAFTLTAKDGEYTESSDVIVALYYNGCDAAKGEEEDYQIKYVFLSDINDDSPEISLVSITMNEGDEAIGDGHTTDDIQIGDDGSIRLRAERSGTGSGRIYTITYQAVDDSGNAAVASATVTVPHDQR